MGVQIPGAVPNGSLHVVLLAVDLADILPTVAAIAMLIMKALSPTDVLHCFVSCHVGVLIVHVLQPFLGLAVAVGLGVRSYSHAPAAASILVEFAWDFSSR